MDKSTVICITAILEEAAKVDARDRDEFYETINKLRSALECIEKLSLANAQPDCMDVVRRIAREALTLND
jgi:hypothetical protein